jgi:hypothetical protein
MVATPSACILRPTDQSAHTKKGPATAKTKFIFYLEGYIHSFISYEGRTESHETVRKKCASRSWLGLTRRSFSTLAGQTCGKQWRRLGLHLRWALPVRSSASSQLNMACNVDMNSL